MDDQKINNQKIGRAIGVFLIVLLITVLSVTTVNALSWDGPGGAYWDDGLGSWVGGYGGYIGGPEWSNYAASVRYCVNPYNNPWRAEVCRRSQSQRG